MSGFLYYLPRELSMTAARAAELGLAYAFDHRRCTFCQVTRGPEEDLPPGVVFADDEAVRSIKLQPELQTWAPFGGDSPIWVGMWNDKRPKPADLLRPSPIPGQWVRDLAGAEWLAPTARRWEDPGENERPATVCNLPLRMRRGSEPGVWLADAVQPLYVRLWEMALAYEAASAAAQQDADEDGNYTIHFPEINVLAILALQTNYRVDEAEIDLLGIYDQSFRDAVIDVLVDRRRLIALLKKKQAMHSTWLASSSTSGPGPSSTDNSAAIDPP